MFLGMDVYYTLFNHSSIEEHLSFQFLAIMNKAAINIYAKIFMWI